MFEKISIQQGELDFGEIAEAMIYYGNVELVVGHKQLITLLKFYGVDEIISLIKSGNLSIFLKSTIIGLQPSERQGQEAKKLIGVTLAGVGTGSNQIRYDEPDDGISRHMARAFGLTKATNAKAETIIESTRFEQNPFAGWRLLKEQASGIETLSTSACAISRLITKGKNGTKFILDVDENDVFRVDTDIDFSRFPSDGVKVASDADGFVMNMVIANDSIINAADGLSDLRVRPGQALILSGTVEALIRQGRRRSAELDLFHEFHFDRKTFRDAVNSGERSPREVVDLVQSEETQRWKSFLRNSRFDASLLEEYGRALAGGRKEFDATKEATKVVASVALDTALGVVLPGVGPAVAASSGRGVLDTLLGQMRKGWRPSQWVEGTASEFLNLRSSK